MALTPKDEILGNAQDFAVKIKNCTPEPAQFDAVVIVYDKGTGFMAVAGTGPKEKIQAIFKELARRSGDNRIITLQ